MRKILLLLLTVVVFSGCEDPVEENVQVAEVEEQQKDAITTRAATVDDESLLSGLFAEDVRLMRNSTRAYGDYLSSRPILPFSHAKVLSLSRNTNINTSIFKILIIVDYPIYYQLKSKIERYACDIYYVYGCEIIMEIVNGGNHTDIKNIIKENQSNLNGVVFIGDISAAGFEISNDHSQYGYASWPCDLYYMDLNGTWTDANGNGIYDSHNGNVQPEIFVGRISTKNMGVLLSEVAGLERYFEKNHNYWTGLFHLNRKFGLSYTDKDWASSSDIKTGIRYLYGASNYDGITYGNPDFGRIDYLSRLKDDRYEFIQLACHASYYHLAMSGGSIYANEVFNNTTKAIGYNLFCCSACDWTSVPSGSSRGFLAGAHIYNPYVSSLVAVGSTKTGSMLGFDKFYTPLGEGKTIGESLKLWWINKNGTTYTNTIISWYYGMTIIGDPMVNFYHLAHSAVSQVTLNGFDSSNTASHRYVVASNTINTNNYIIPSSKSIIFKAPNVALNGDFACDVNSTLEIAN